MTLLALAAAAALADPTSVALERLGPTLPGVARQGSALRWAGGTQVRVRHTLEGLPVDGGDRLVSLDPGSRVRRIRGSALAPAGAGPARIAAADAVEAARRLSVRLGRGALWEPRATRVYRIVQGRPRLAWRVDLSTARPLATWRTWVDARTGALLDTRLTSRSASGNVYPQNPVTSTLTEVELLRLDDGATVLDGHYTLTRSCEDWTITEGLFGISECNVLAPHAIADGAGDFFYPHDPASIADPLAEVQVYHHTDRVASWMEDRYGFRLDGPIRSIVNFEMANAFFGDFDGDGVPDVSFGHDPETGVDLGYDADVVYHEFGHAVVSGLADLPFVGADAWGMDWVAGSINEGFADVLSMALTGDPLTGEYAGSAFERAAIRDLDADRRCPDDLQGEVHADGQILGSLAWNISEEVGTDVMIDLFVGSLPAWGFDVSWPGVGTSLLDAAADLLDAGVLDGGGHDAIVAEIEQSGILDCGRTLPLDDGRERELFLLNGGLQGDLERIPLGVQLTVDVPRGAESLTFHVHGLEGQEGMGWAIYARAGSHVVHEVTSVDLLGIAVARPDVFDGVVEGEGVGQWTLDGASDPPLVGGQTWYFSVTSRNIDVDLFDFQFARLTVSADLSPPPKVPPRGGGCGCATGPTPAPTVAWLAALVGLRRRRSRRVHPVPLRGKAVRW